MLSRRPIRRAAGFSFIEILVVMGIIATLAGLGLVVVSIARRRGPEQATRATVTKVKGYIDAWKVRFHVPPPMRVKSLPKDAGTIEPKFGSPNSENDAIEALYQAFYVEGFGAVEFGDSEVANLDEDKLLQKLTSRGVELYEIIDAYGNPLIYFEDTGYAASDKNPPSYSSNKEGTVNPVPYKEPGGGFVNPKGFQIFSMGPDGKPNTDDDILGW